jgi:ADP-ribosylglycohydrolase
MIEIHEQKMLARSRGRGVLLGVGAGDSLGHGIEFQSRERIRAAYGSKGVTHPQQVRRTFHPTDDTQLTLLVAESLNEARDFRNIAETGRILGEKLAHWHDHPRERHFAPGGACMRGSYAIGRGTPWWAGGGGDDGGCGAVMRSSPYGIAFRNPEVAAVVAAEHGCCTHRAPLSIFSTAYYAALTSMLVHREESAVHLHDLVTNAIEVGRNAALQLIPWTRKAVEEVDSTIAMISEASTFKRGEDAGMKWDAWAGHTAAAAATCILLCSAWHEGEDEHDIARARFETGLQWAVNHDGDSDSLGAIAGGLLGAYYGDVLDKRWTDYAWANDLILLGEKLVDVAYDVAPMTGLSRVTNEEHAA